MTALSRHRAFIVVLIVYAAILAIQMDHGLASGDGHGIVRTVQRLLNSGKIDPSRPPGHPTTELYLFGASGWMLLNAFGIEFSDRVYLICQAIAALVALIVFYELVLRIGASRWRALLATICLACAAPFISNALDGEEFVFGLLFLLIAFRLLISAPTTFIRLSLSIFCFALATGCRAELIFAAIIFPVYCLFDSKLGWKWAFATIGLLAFSVVVVWLPVLLVGIRAPYNVAMGLRELILGSVYRIIFQAFTPVIFLLLGWTLVAALPNLRRKIDARDFVFTISCVVPIVFLAIFFLYPSKAGHLLAAIPFLLLLAVDRSLGFLVTLSVFSGLSLFVNIDIFKDRQLVRPHWTAGSYFQAVDHKPYYKLDYLRKLSDQCESRPSVIIGEAGPWDFEYHIERNNLSAREQGLHGQIKHELPAFFAGGDYCIFLPAEAAYESALLKEWQGKGYAIKIDAKLYRTLFARYDVRSSLPSGAVDVGGVFFTLCRVN